MRMILMLAGLLALSPAAAPAQRAPAPRWATVVAVTPQGGYRQGNPAAPVKLVEYGSRTCPTCQRFAVEGVGPLTAGFIATGKVSYEYRDYLVHGVPDLALALLNQCVPTARFFAVLDAIYAAQPVFHERIDKLVTDAPERTKQWQALPPAQAATRFAEALGFLPFMQKLGLSEVQARKCLADPVRIRRVAQTNAGAVTLHGVAGTPTFFINGRKMRAISWLQLQPELWASGA
jgi:protein-disulfide isomerase